MRRLVTILAVATLAAAFIVVPASAGGAGGFCRMGGLTDQKTTEVELGKYCFTPTVARIQPGDEVTFTNFDPDLHMVGGVAGSFGDLHTELAPKESISYTFKEEGVYPYVCILHPGMAGAIVVGDGAGKITTSSVIGGTLQAPPSGGTAEGDTVATADAVAGATDTEPTAATTRDAWPIGLVALAIAVAAAVWLPRRKAPQLEG